MVGVAGDRELRVGRRDAKITAGVCLVVGGVDSVDAMWEFELLSMLLIVVELGPAAGGEDEGEDVLVFEADLGVPGRRDDMTEEPICVMRSLRDAGEKREGRLLAQSGSSALFNFLLREDEALPDPLS